MTILSIINKQHTHQSVTEHNNIKYIDTQHNANIMALSIALKNKTLSTTLCQIFLTEFHYAGCHYTERHYAECHYTECRGAS
jgi:hypothetical protein